MKPFIEINSCRENQYLKLVIADTMYKWNINISCKGTTIMY